MPLADEEVHGMKRVKVLAVVVALSLGVVGAFAGPARASTAYPGEYDFYSCNGPGPSDFTAVKEYLPTGFAAGASAFRIVEGGTGIFIVLDFGFGAPPGPTTNGILTTSCLVTLQGYGETTFSGFLVPPGH
jgi:hypothetical protein